MSLDIHVQELLLSNLLNFNEKKTHIILAEDINLLSNLGVALRLGQQLWSYWDGQLT